MRRARKVVAKPVMRVRYQDQLNVGVMKIVQSSSAEVKGQFGLFHGKTSGGSFNIYNNSVSETCKDHQDSNYGHQDCCIPNQEYEQYDSDKVECETQPARMEQNF